MPMPTQRCLESDMSNSYRVIQNGDSPSFPGEHPFLSQADAQAAAVVYLGAGSGAAFEAAPEARFVAIELGNECLGVHAGPA